MRARLMEGVPGGIVLFVADPDREIVVNPAAGKQRWQRVARRMLVEILADLQRMNIAGPRAALIECAQKTYSAPWIMLPAVFTIKNDSNQGWGLTVDGLADVAEMTEKILHG